MLRKCSYIQFVIIVICFCFFSSVFAAQEYTDLKGVWENAQYKEGVWKLVFQADGSYEALTKEGTSKNTIKGKCKIVERWTDSEGCLCFKTILMVDKGEKSYCLMKISSSGKMLEYVEDSREYPKFFSSEAYIYRKLYRK